MSSALCKVYAQNTADSGLAFAVGGGKLDGGCLQRIPHLFSNLVSWKGFESVSLSFFLFVSTTSCHGLYETWLHARTLLKLSWNGKNALETALQVAALYVQIFKSALRCIVVFLNFLQPNVQTPDPIVW